MANFDTEKIAELEKLLKDLPQVKEIRNLRKRINAEKKKITSIPKMKKITVKIDVNTRRTAKMKKYHRYIRMIKDVYFPKMKYRDIQRQLKIRKSGNMSDIPDAVWQNPSP